jgi:hypothetical protein
MWNLNMISPILFLFPHFNDFQSLPVVLAFEGTGRETRGLYSRAEYNPKEVFWS